eukprot:scaffold1028_cov135-Cylindrotheca_fusiformis.AAC.8
MPWPVSWGYGFDCRLWWTTCTYRSNVLVFVWGLPARAMRLLITVGRVLLVEHVVESQCLLLGGDLMGFPPRVSSSSVRRQQLSREIHRIKSVVEEKGVPYVHVSYIGGSHERRFLFDP